MKRKYIVFLVVIGVMLFATLSIGTGYGVWLSSKTPSEVNTRVIDCFKVYYDNDGIVEMNKIKPVLKEDGETTSPYTITISNICEEEHEVQIRLNTIEKTTINPNALTLKVVGDIESDVILYKNLETTKTQEEGITVSKLIGKIKIEPNQTVRTNIRMWFDEKKVPNVDEKTNYYKGHFEILDSKREIKPTLVETLLEDKETINKKEAPNFDETSNLDDGLYAIKAAGGNYYYYRGVVHNNYIKFADFTWRIVGINPDNTIKLVLENAVASANYSAKSKAIDYTGFKYDYNKVAVNNDITNYLYQWYNNNIKNRGFDEYVIEYKFCNDSSYIQEKNHTYFGAYNRLVEDKAPITTCPATKLDFGGIYSQKVGLLTADEVALAGGVYNINNYNYYLYNGGSFFTASPFEGVGNTAYITIVNENGSITKDKTDTAHGIRPVINISGDIIVSGSGTKENPYVMITK